MHTDHFASEMFIAEENTTIAYYHTLKGVSHVTLRVFYILFLLAFSSQSIGRLYRVRHCLS